MPRQARVVLPGELYHVTQRGNFRQKVFFDDQDRFVYLKYFEKYALSHRLGVYAFCLMDNHVHFIVKPNSKESLADVFKITHQKYSLYLNKRLGQFGHRWQSRFYSCVLFGGHIEKALLYVERNPVRAHIVRKPWHFKWSSAQAHLGRSRPMITLADIREYIAFSSWEECLSQGEDPASVDDIRMATRQGKAFAPKEFIAKIESDTGLSLKIRPRGRQPKS